MHVLAVFCLFLFSSLVSWYSAKRNLCYIQHWSRHSKQESAQICVYPRGYMMCRQCVVEAHSENGRSSHNFFKSYNFLDNYNNSHWPTRTRVCPPQGMALNPLANFRESSERLEILQTGMGELFSNFWVKLTNSRNSRSHSFCTVLGRKNLKFIIASNSRMKPTRRFWTRF